MDYHNGARRCRVIFNVAKMESVLNVPILNIRQVLQFRDREKVFCGEKCALNKIQHKLNTRLISIMRERNDAKEENFFFKLIKFKAKPRIYCE
jgi:hypothetical protein